MPFSARDGESDAGDLLINEADNLLERGRERRADDREECAEDEKRTSYRTYANSEPIDC